jgi:hypothetical protein
MEIIADAPGMSVWNYSNVEPGVVLSIELLALRGTITAVARRVIVAGGGSNCPLRQS